MRYQESPIKKTKGKNPKWFIRPYVDVLQPDGSLLRERRRFYLGSLESSSKDDAKAKRKEVLYTLNDGNHVLQVQVNFGEVLNTYESRFLLAKNNLSASTQAKYTSLIKNHVRPGFGPLCMADITTQQITD